MKVRWLVLIGLLGNGISAADDFVRKSDSEPGAEIIDMRDKVPAEVEVKPFPTPFEEPPPMVAVPPPKQAEQPAPEVEPEAPPKPEPKPIHPDIQVFLDGHYVKTHCEKLERCEEILRLNCDYRQEGPVYYFDNLAGETLMTCGSACLEPDPHDPLGCKECPPRAWKDCRQRQVQAQRAAEEAQRKAEQAAYRKLQEQERAIEKKMLEAEKDYQRRMHELEDAMDQIYEQEQNP